MTRPVGYYVHHQGAGHLHRALRVARRLDRPVTLLGTGLAGTDATILDLPDDRLSAAFAGEDGEPERPASFHYAPLGHDGVRGRMARLAGWMAEADPALVVVDVSVEVALLARLLSVPTVVVRLAGERVDVPHLEAFRAATRLVAPFPAALEAASTPDWVRRKTLYAGLLAERPAALGEGDGRVVVLLGRGGGGPSGADLVAAARAVPDRAWHVIGLGGAEMAEAAPNLHLHGWVDDVPDRLASASVVVGSGGDGVVAAVAAAGKRFVCLPQDRPFREQAAKAEGLARIGAAIVRDVWPAAAAWPALLAEAERLDPARLAALVPEDAFGALAGAIGAVADGSDLRLRTPGPAGDGPRRSPPAPGAAGSRGPATDPAR